ncbi:MAG: hypothetical protein MUE94_14005, partial [Verrucomicrobia bacterium]|nr:hypothetical protein [Verrucomicrobiota bacterium]
NSQVRGNIFFNTGSPGTGSGWAQEGGYNTVTDPGLAFIDRTQLAKLDPTLVAGSPALTPNPSYVAPAGDVLEAAQYVGAFTDNNWALNWTALDGNAYFRYCTAPLPALVCPQPTLSIAPNGANVDVSWSSTQDCVYQLQSKSPITGAWSNVGSVVVGDGSTKTLPVANTGVEKYFRLIVL